MNTYLIKEETLTDIADAIREKTSDDQPIQVSDFASEIENIETGGGLDWSAIGYSETPSFIVEGYNYAKQIYDNWDDSVSLKEKYFGDRKLFFFPLVVLGQNQTNLSNCFRDTPLIEFPLIDMSKVGNISYCFYGCYSLEYVPVLDLSSVWSMTSTFTDCRRLSDSALDNILQSCITATGVQTRYKYLSSIGFTSNNYPASRIQALPHYQNFINAGWSIGY